MTKKPSRVRVLLMPYQDNDDSLQDLDHTGSQLQSTSTTCQTGISSPARPTVILVSSSMKVRT